MGGFKNCVIIRIYADLNYFLDKNERQSDIEVCFYGKRSVKDLIESMGVPHVEVHRILVDGDEAGFDHILEGHERISVYPKLSLMKESGENTCGDESKFILDVHLGKLAMYLRMLGFDVFYDTGIDDPEIARISADEDRILLTRDRGLLMRSIVKRGLIIRNSNPVLQAAEVIEYFNLEDSIRPLAICLECNGKIERLTEGSPEFDKAKKQVPPKVRDWCDEYYICRGCGKVYWRGTHYYDMVATILKMLGKSGGI
ncbi:hypothetical protein SAMN02745945_02397 [Peptoclostridium litorale DSM 5388]|uniref:Twitching motility protein PilT n=1 Tax=Peptoclostridium litorale DSM 5388 TaxID=1121324 RepID=A0A069RH31_PEPLI|nr:Mut7-C RNAse domain-containing protein [Peptoclostridium litorale]KDR96316.1 hypothetical protein CLIT_4c01530 [Peptoclostridium litorale DSM 5388]SIO26243.1 hypothetical protein SAMN02745945_02397 [Peptoclostridium litorale DSM 5388]